MLLSFSSRNPGMTKVMIGDALINEDERLQLRMNQFVDRIELALKQALRLSVVAGELKPANQGNLLKIADTVAANAIKLSDTGDGSKWAAVDPLIPGPDKYKGTPYAP